MKADYKIRLESLHNKIQSTRATTLTKKGQRWVRTMNRIRTILAYL